MTITRLSPGARYSGAVVRNGTVYLAGQVPTTTLDKGIMDQTAEVIANIDAMLAVAGTDKSNLLTVNVWLPNITTFAAMNEVWDDRVDKANLPARTTCEGRIADPRILIEVTVVAALP